jgi:hypothetical protein
MGSGNGVRATVPVTARRLAPVVAVCAAVAPLAARATWHTALSVKPRAPASTSASSTRLPPGVMSLVATLVPTCAKPQTRRPVLMPVTEGAVRVPDCAELLP